MKILGMRSFSVIFGQGGARANKIKCYWQNTAESRASGNTNSKLRKAGHGGARQDPSTQGVEAERAEKNLNKKDNRKKTNLIMYTFLGFLVWNRVSCSPGWQWICYVAEDEPDSFPGVGPRAAHVEGSALPLNWIPSQSHIVFQSRSPYQVLSYRHTDHRRTNL